MAQHSNTHLRYWIDVPQEDSFLPVFRATILHFLILVFTQLQKMFCSLYSSFPTWLLLNSLSTFLLLSIVIRELIQFNRLILKNESIFTSPSTCISYYICLICIYFNPTHILLKSFPTKLARRSAIFFSVPKIMFHILSLVLSMFSHYFFLLVGVAFLVQQYVYSMHFWYLLQYQVLIYLSLLDLLGMK